MLPRFEWSRPDWCSALQCHVPDLNARVPLAFLSHAEAMRSESLETLLRSHRGAGRAAATAGGGASGFHAAVAMPDADLAALYPHLAPDSPKLAPLALGRGGGGLLRRSSASSGGSGGGSCGMVDGSSGGFDASGCLGRVSLASGGDRTSSGFPG